ncbi:formylglycine-generating enzyme family protein [Fulvivirgaceae bacterium BMA10]|uniref:Formylglycine-generating enzyme family protein n=1 Tax=Splendidivirga corallicola TaxID=3051826 RepID=A0ABT8KI74_9BACT|nr:formylglycine-generating enzyme family protein [Fulvivirgaceae bacterium BMA10]
MFGTRRLIIVLSVAIISMASIHLSFKEKEEKFDERSYSQIIPGSDISIEMIAIPGGEFMMGSPSNEKGRNSDEGPVHKVKIDPFWMGKYEITWNQYRLFRERLIDNKPSKFTKGKEINIEVDGVSAATAPYVDMSFGMGKDGYPAINITQYAASTFCKWLSAKTGYFYRLPTEAEWEYACRAGTTTAYHFGNDVSKLGEYAWFYENSDGAYKKGGLKKPNPWGLYDMHGNVSEWTIDQYLPEFYTQTKGSTAVNPLAEPKVLYPRVARGGSWDDDPEVLRSAARQASNKRWKQRDPQLPKSLWWHTNAPFIGFRIVRSKNIPKGDELKKYWVGPIEDK